MRRLKFPPNQMFGKTYREEDIVGEPYQADKLAEHRETFAQNILILFYPFRTLESFNITEHFIWWDSLLSIRDLGHFSKKSIFHIENIQSWNDTFLCKSEGSFLGEETDSDTSDTEYDIDFSIASYVMECIYLFDEENKQ